MCSQQVLPAEKRVAGWILIYRLPVQGLHFLAEGQAVQPAHICERRRLDSCNHFFPNEKAPPPAFASFFALSAARFSSLALPPLGLFFSDLALGLGLKGSLGGMAEPAGMKCKLVRD